MTTPLEDFHPIPSIRIGDLDTVEKCDIAIALVTTEANVAHEAIADMEARRDESKPIDRRVLAQLRSRTASMKVGMGFIKARRHVLNRRGSTDRNVARDLAVLDMIKEMDPDAYESAEREVRDERPELFS